jgi:hypothetical protein
MTTITIPIEIDLTPRSCAIMDALAKAISPQFQAAEEPIAPAPLLNLQPEEHYAGVLLDKDGELVCHLVLMADKPSEKLNWQDAKDWAERVGGHLPTRQEASLLFANCKPHLDEAWHWTSETYEPDASYAWYCYFYDGDVGYDHESYEGCAGAVRRV